jgi:hypothetical protein
MMDLRFGHRLPRALKGPFQMLMRWFDKPFVPHKAVYRLKKERVNAIKQKQGVSQLLSQSVDQSVDQLDLSADRSIRSVS